MTRMARKQLKCLFCNKPAGSKEHIFPAALGGRRVDKRIFCSKDNRRMGCLANILVDQLSLVNARLSVVSDNSGEPRVHKHFDPETGITFDLTGQNLEVAEPTVLSDVATAKGREVRMLFGSQQQVDEWLHQQRAAGFNVQVGSKEIGQRLFSKPLRIPLHLGKAVELRAIAYLGLTYLAHFRPDLVRTNALSPFLSYVKDRIGDGYVWWEEKPLSLPAYPESHRFQHRIAISLDEKTGQLSGHVDLFSAFSYGLKFGTLSDEAPFTYIADINPMVEIPPNDRVVYKIDGATLFSYAGADTGTAKHAASIGKGSVAKRVSDLFADIDNWHWEQEAHALAARLNSAATKSPVEWHGQLMQELEGQSQRLFNMMTHIATTFRRLHGNQQGMDKVADALDKMVATDTKDHEQSNMSHVALHLARMTIAGEFERILRSHQKITETDLRDLLMGGRGLGLIGTTMFRAMGVPVK